MSSVDCKTLSRTRLSSCQCESGTIKICRNTRAGLMFSNSIKHKLVICTIQQGWCSLESVNSGKVCRKGLCDAQWSWDIFFLCVATLQDIENAVQPSPSRGAQLSFLHQVKFHFMYSARLQYQSSVAYDLCPHCSSLYSSYEAIKEVAYSYLDVKSGQSLSGKILPARAWYFSRDAINICCGILRADH